MKERRTRLSSRFPLTSIVSSSVVDIIYINFVHRLQYFLGYCLINTFLTLFFFSNELDKKKSSFIEVPGWLKEAWIILEHRRPVYPETKYSEL